MRYHQPEVIAQAELEQFIKSEGDPDLFQVLCLGMQKNIIKHIEVLQEAMQYIMAILANGNGSKEFCCLYFENGAIGSWHSPVIGPIAQPAAFKFIHPAIGIIGL